MDLKSPPSHRPTLYGTRHLVVAGHHLAAMAAMRLLEAGGNAIDAGVGAGFALNVVQPDMANLGGVAPVMLRTADGRVTTIAGVGRWPRRVTRDELARVGGGRIPNDVRRWVVPAAPDAWLHALQRFGTLTLAEVLQPAIELAAGGFVVNYFTHHNLAVSEAAMTKWPHTREVYFPDGRAPRVGERLVQDALAGTLRALVEAAERAPGGREAGVQAARDRFYRGDIAQAMADFAREQGAYLDEADLRDYAAAEMPAFHTSYRGHTVYSCGPWCQGPSVLQALSLLRGYRLGDLAPAARTHVAIEAMNLALAERNRWYGDPDHVRVPMDRLLSDEHAEALRRRIDPERAGATPPTDARGPASPDTTYVAVIDRHGNAFSATPSDSTILATPMVPGLGIGISNRGLQASLDPADPNVVAPGKRPRLTPNPGLVVGPLGVMAYGTPGGDVQPQAMTQFLVNWLDHRMELQAAVEAPRWASYAVPITEDPHPATPRLVRVESALHEAVGDELVARGHRVERWPTFAADAGGVCAVLRDPATGLLSGAADPRRMSYGIAW